MQQINVTTAVFYLFINQTSDVKLSELCVYGIWTVISIMHVQYQHFILTTEISVQCYELYLSLILLFILLITAGLVPESRNMSTVLTLVLGSLLGLLVLIVMVGVLGISMCLCICCKKQKDTGKGVSAHNQLHLLILIIA